MAVTGVAQGEVGSGLLRDENGHLRLDPVLPRRRAGQGVGADGELSHGKDLVAAHDVLDDILPAGILKILLSGLVRGIKVPAAGLHRPAAFKADPEIPEQKAVNVDLRHMEKPLRPLQHRRGKDLARGDVDVRDTVLEPGLPGRVGQPAQRDPEVCFISALPFYLRVVTDVQDVDDLLLKVPVQLRIQGIDAEDVVEKRREEIPGLRQRPGDDREGGLLVRHKLVPQSQVRIHIGCPEFPLLRIQGECRRALRRLKLRLPEGLDHRRAGIALRLFPQLPVGQTEFRKFPVGECLIPEKGTVKTVVIVELPVRAPADLPLRASREPLRHPHRGAGKNGLQAGLRKAFRRQLHQPLKTTAETDRHRGPGGKILPQDFEPGEEAVHHGVRRGAGLLLRQGIQERGGFQSFRGNIVSGEEQIPEILRRHPVVQCLLHIAGKQKFPAALRDRDVKIVEIVPVEGVPDRGAGRDFSPGKEAEDLKIDLQYRGDILVPSFKNKFRQCVQLRVQGGKRRAGHLPRGFLFPRAPVNSCTGCRRPGLLRRIRRIQPALPVLPRKHLPVQPVLQLLHFRKTALPVRSGADLLPEGKQTGQERCRRTKKVMEGLTDPGLFRDLRDPFHGKTEPLFRHTAAPTIIVMIHTAATIPPIESPSTANL